MGAVSRKTVKKVVPCRCLDGHVKKPNEMSMALGARPLVKLLLQSARTSVCRHIHNWNIVACDVKQPISLTAGIATPPTTMYQSCIPNAILEPPSNFFRAAYHPYRIHPLPPSHQLHTYTFKPSCTQPCLSVSIFWIAYLSSPNTAKYMYFPKIPISPILSSRVVYTPLSMWVFLPQLPGPPHISSQDDVKPIKQTS